jgi:hypothetical protein
VSSVEVHFHRRRQARAQHALHLLRHVERTRTGTRCTIFVKLPVAFSAGSTLKVAPVAG